MTLNSSLFTSNNEEWETPTAFFDKLHEEFCFFIDMAATHYNSKCVFFMEDIFKNTPYSSVQNDYFGEGISVFLNPPYGKKIKSFIEQAIKIASFNGWRLVMLLPSRTDTRWYNIFWDFEKHKCRPYFEIRPIKGRLRFELDGLPMLDKKGKPMNAPFPSTVVIFDGYARMLDKRA